MAKKQDFRNLSLPQQKVRRGVAGYAYEKDYDPETVETKVIKAPPRTKSVKKAAEAK